MIRWGHQSRRRRRWLRQQQQQLIFSLEGLLLLLAIFCQVSLFVLATEKDSQGGEGSAEKLSAEKITAEERSADAAVEVREGRGILDDVASGINSLLRY